MPEPNPLLRLLRRVEEADWTPPPLAEPNDEDIEDEHEVFDEAERLVPEGTGMASFESSVVVRDFDRYWRRGKVPKEVATDAILLLERVLTEKGVL